MLIGIDASRTTIASRTGTESYSTHIIKGLIEKGGAHQFRLYFRDDPPLGLFPNSDTVERVVIRQARFWTHRGLGPAVRRNPPDVLFVPSHVVPWPGTGGVPSVVTIHDMGYLRFPNAHPLGQRLYLDWSTRHSTRVAKRVIAVSQATADDLAALNGVPKTKIKVIHSGVESHYRPVEQLPEIVAVRDRYHIPGPYILHVGSIHLRKNPIRLVEAFARLAGSIPELNLVFAGRPGWGFGSLKQRIKGLGITKQVIFAGYTAEDDMPALYSGARVLAFPSLYEGFGFPALEAMACGLPVVCSNTSSLPEIVGEAALIVNPLDVVAISEALAHVLTDEAFHTIMSAHGRERASQFSWKTAARDTLQVLEEAASS